MEENPSSQSMVQHHRWGFLPCDLLNKIISFLNFPKNSIITISTTTFNIVLFEPVTYNISEFWNILDNLFTIFTTPSINTFCIHLHQTLYEEPRIRPILNSWAHRLRARNFQHISIKLYYYYCFQIGDIVCPPILFQINSLVSLNLYNFILNELDRFVSHPIILPNLKKLVLGLVNYEILRLLLSCCPSIEDLSFETTPKGNIQSRGPLSISSKNLKRLSITHIISSMCDFNHAKVIIIDAPKLEYFHLNANNFLTTSMFDLIYDTKTHQIDGGSTTKKLDDNKTIKIIFPNLTHLALPLSCDILKATFGQQTMMDCPKLEVLELNFLGFYWSGFNWDPEAIVVLLEKVKRLELRMRAVEFTLQTLNLVTLLLRSAPVLEKLILDAQYGSYWYGQDVLSKAQFRKTIFECAKDSSGCQIELLGAFNLKD